MCGIVGYIGHRDARSFLNPALRRLEYRGYDSAGLATVNGTRLDVRKAVGKIATLEAEIAPAPPEEASGSLTRAGRPTDARRMPMPISRK